MPENEEYQGMHTGAEVDAAVDLAMEQETTKANVNDVFENVQPENFPTLPYPIQKTALGKYRLGVDIFAQKAEETYTHFYVDSVNGSDTNAGTSENAPVKTFKKALQQAASKAAWNKAYIHIAAGSVMWDDGLYGEYSVKKSTIIDGNGCQMIWGVESPDWEEYAQAEGVYVSKNLSSQKCGAVIEMSDENKDMYGLYRGYKSAASIGELEAGSYFWDSTDNLMYVYPRAGADISDIHPLRTSYGLRWNFALASEDAFVYMKGVNYIGNQFISSRTQSYPLSGKTIELFYENCSFSHCFNGDCVGASNFDNCYIINCTGGYSNQDVFNHHVNSMTSEGKASAVYVNMNCHATEAGWYHASSNTCNLYTGHDGMNILRLNCDGSNAQGPMLADVNGCRSVNQDINIINNGYASSSVTACIEFNNVDAEQEGLASLVNVNAGDIARATAHKLATSGKVEMTGGNLWDDIVVAAGGEIVARS